MEFGNIVTCSGAERPTQQMFRCAINKCPEIFSTAQMRKTHRQIMHPLRKVKCSFCDLLLCATSMTHHKRRAHSDKYIDSRPDKVHPKCPNCGKIFTSGHFSNRHKLVCQNKGPRLFKCTKGCDIAFRIEHEQKNHEAIVHADLVCCYVPGCGKLFKKHYLNRHVQAMHCKNCSKCGKHMEYRELSKHSCTTVPKSVSTEKGTDIVLNVLRKHAESQYHPKPSELSSASVNLQDEDKDEDEDCEIIYDKLEDNRSKWNDNIV